MQISILLCAFCILCSQGLLAATNKSASSTSVRPFLIVPGNSIGKVVLGQKRETVLHKMSFPTSTLRRKVEIEDRGKKITVNVIQDDWVRKVSSEEKKKRGSYLNDRLSVFYVDNKVIQVSVSLTGYSTQNGLGMYSSFNSFANTFGKYKEYCWHDEPSSPEMTSNEGSTAGWCIWDFEQHGLAIESRVFSPRSG